MRGACQNMSIESLLVSGSLFSLRSKNNNCIGTVYTINKMFVFLKRLPPQGLSLVSVRYIICSKKYTVTSYRDRKMEVSCFLVPPVLTVRFCLVLGWLETFNFWFCWEMLGVWKQDATRNSEIGSDRSPDCIPHHIQVRVVVLYRSQTGCTVGMSTSRARRGEQGELVTISCDGDVVSPGRLVILA